MLPMSPLFPNFPQKTADMLKFDLRAAGIPYQNEQGHYVDFHALRHSFISNLARSNVHPKVAQSLARHSTIELTMNAYTHISLESEVAALEKLPRLEARDRAIV